MDNWAFYLFALGVIISALGVIKFNCYMYSILSLIITFISTAGLFIVIGAEFLAMILIIVYVGAVAILFLFIIMMLNIKNKDDRVVSISFCNVKQLKQSLIYSGIYITCLLIFVLLPVVIDVISKLGQSRNFLDLMYLFSKSEWLVCSPQADWQTKFLILFISAITARIITQFLQKYKIFNIIHQDIYNFIVILIGIGLLYLLMQGVYSVEISLVSDSLAVSSYYDSNTNTKSIGLALYHEHFVAFQICGIILLITMIGAILLCLDKKNHHKKQKPSQQIQRNPKESVTLVAIPLKQGIEI